MNFKILTVCLNKKKKKKRPYSGQKKRIINKENDTVNILGMVKFLIKLNKLIC